MPTPREDTIWSSVRVQLSDTQRFLLEGKYREAVLRGRELLHTLVRMQMNDACLVSTDLSGDIEQLFENRRISAAAREHYQQVNRMAAQADSGAEISAQAANDAFTLLRQELSDYVERGQRTQSRTEDDTAGGAPELSVSRRYTSSQRGEGAELNIPVRRRAAAEPERERVRMPRRSSGDRRERDRSSARSGRAVRMKSRPAAGRSGHRGSGRYAREEVSELDIYSILKIVLPLLCLILAVILIRVLTSGGKPEIQTSPAAVTETIIETTEAPTEPETTEPETTEAPKRWVTTDGVRVRTKPSTEGSEVLTVLEPGTELQYRGDYDADWIKIDYNGQEAYVARAYVRAEEIS